MSAFLPLLGAKRTWRKYTNKCDGDEGASVGVPRKTPAQIEALLSELTERMLGHAILGAFRPRKDDITVPALTALLTLM